MEALGSMKVVRALIEGALTGGALVPGGMIETPTASGGGNLSLALGNDNRSTWPNLFPTLTGEPMGSWRPTGMFSIVEITDPVDAAGWGIQYNGDENMGVQFTFCINFLRIISAALPENFIRFGLNRVRDGIAGQAGFGREFKSNGAVRTVDTGTGNPNSYTWLSQVNVHNVTLQQDDIIYPVGQGSNITDSIDITIDDVALEFRGIS